MLFQTKGIDRHFRRQARYVTLEDTFAWCIVEILFGSSRGSGSTPLSQVIKHIIGQLRCGAVVDPAGLIAPGVIGGAITGRDSTAGTTGRSSWIDAGQLMWVSAIAVEVLHAASRAIERCCPGLA